MAITTLEELKQKSFHLQHNTAVYFPCVKRAVEFCTKQPKLQRKSWFDKGGIAAFVDEVGETYLIPKTEAVGKILTENGYHRAYIVIPFFEGAYPAREEENKKWQAVLATVVA